MKVQKVMSAKFHNGLQVYALERVERENPQDGIHTEDIDELRQNLRDDGIENGEFEVAYVDENGKVLAKEDFVWDAFDDALQTHLGIHG